MSETASTAILSDPVYKLHATGAGHPERPERYDTAVKALASAGLTPKMLAVEARPGTEDEVALCHSRRYIEIVKRDVASGANDLSTGDTAICAKSLDVALKAVGGVLNAVDTVCQRKARNAICIVRPPGHHATPERGMGFCIFNNIAIAARYAQRKHGIARVMIVDWDVHHGNGTQDIFYRDGSVFFFSTHQHPWYPGTGMPDQTGEGAGAGKNMNCPFPAGSGRKEILGAFESRLIPAAEQFKPELLLVSAGFDSRLGDPLGKFTLSDSDFTDLTKLMLEVADKHAGGRLVSVLEGGYNLSGIGPALTAHTKSLMGASAGTSG